MLTKLANGDHVDLPLATRIYVNESKVTVHAIADGFVSYFAMPSLEEAQAEAEADRLAEIANNQRTGVVMLNNSYFKASDVIETQVKAFPRSWACRVFIRENRSTDVWFDAPAGTSDKDLAAALFACEQEARAYARDLMAQAARAK
jgi:hypothetical protein